MNIIELLTKPLFITRLPIGGLARPLLYGRRVFDAFSNPNAPSKSKDLIKCLITMATLRSGRPPSKTVSIVVPKSRDHLPRIVFVTLIELS